MDWSKNGVLEGAFCRRRLNYVFPLLFSSSDPLLSPVPQRQSTQWGRLADQGEREGWQQTVECVGLAGRRASQVAFDPIMPLVVMVHKQMAALGHIEKMNSDIQGHKIAFVCQPIQPSRVVGSVSLQGVNC